MASMQATGRPIRFISCQSQLDITPVAKPILSALGGTLRSWQGLALLDGPSLSG
jgi:hypothetical protein